MTQTLAYWIGGLILLFLLLDAYWLNWDVPVAVGRQLVALLDWMAFWR
ncbi:MAG: hypothetical protein AAGA70_05085 [Pseudomonadota bacterium]